MTTSSTQSATILTTVTLGSMVGLADVDPARLAADDTLVALGNTGVVRRYWVPDGAGVDPHGFVGEDIGATAAVRFVNRYLPYAMLTVNYHVVDLRERSRNHPAVHPTPFIVEEVIEYLIAEQPIADGAIREVWSDCTYAYASARFATLVEAEQDRDRRAAEQAARRVGERFYWNGSRQ